MIHQSRLNKFTPQNINGLICWFDAGYGLFKSDGTSAVADGDAVATWVSHSNNVATAVQATGSKQPLLKLNQINNRPAISFDAADDTMLVSLGISSTRPSTFMVVFKVNSTGTSRIIFDSSSVANRKALLINTSDQAVLVSNSNQTVGPAIAINTFQIALCAWSRNAAQNYGEINTKPMFASTDTNKSLTLSSLSLGPITAASFPNGMMAELVFFDKSLSSNEVSLMYGYWKNKYSL